MSRFIGGNQHLLPLAVCTENSMIYLLVCFPLLNAFNIPVTLCLACNRNFFFNSLGFCFWFSFCVFLCYVAAFFSIFIYLPFPFSLCPPLLLPLYSSPHLVSMPDDVDTDKEQNRAPALGEFTICWAEDQHMFKKRGKKSREIMPDGLNFNEEQGKSST